MFMSSRAWIQILAQKDSYNGIKVIHSCLFDQYCLLGFSCSFLMHRPPHKIEPIHHQRRIGHQPEQHPQGKGEDLQRKKYNSQDSGAHQA